MKNNRKYFIGFITLVSILGISDNNINNGLTLTDTGIAIGKGSISTGTGTIAIGNNSFASGNNLTKEDYEKLLKENNEKFSNIDTKLNLINAYKSKLNELNYKNENIKRIIENINNLKFTLNNKTAMLNEEQPRIEKEIEIKRNEAISYRREIEDLEKRINIINSLNFDSIQGNFEKGVKTLALDLKNRMEDGKSFIKKYNENGIDVKNYEDFIKSFVARPKNSDLLNEIRKYANLSEYNSFMYIGTNDEPIYILYGVKGLDLNYYLTDINLLGKIEADIYNKYTYELYPRGAIAYDFKNKQFKRITRNASNDFNISDSNEFNTVELFDSFKNLKNNNRNYISSKKVDGNNITLDGLEEYYNPEFEIAIKNLEYKYNISTEKPKSSTSIFAEKMDKFDEIYKNLATDIIKFKMLHSKANKTDEEYFELSRIENRFNNLEKDKIISPLINEIKSKYNINTTDIANYFKKYINNNYYHINIDNIYKYLIDKEQLKTKIIEYFDNFELNKIVELGKEYNRNMDIITNSSKVIKVFKEEIDRLKALEKDATEQINTKTNYIDGLRKEISDLNAMISNENNPSNEAIIKEIEDKEEKIRIETLEIENLKKNIINISSGENAIAYGTNSISTGKDSIAFGINNFVSGENSISIGKNNIMYGKNSIAIGVDNLVKGKDTGVFGDPNIIYANNSYAIGNNNLIGTEKNLSENIFILGSNIDARNVSNAIILGNNSQAVENAVSVGSKNNERKIVNIADGEISETSKEAINGSQLYKFAKNLKLNLDNPTKIITSNEGVANAIAAASLPQVSGSKLFSFSIGAGYYEKHFSVAVGFSGQTKQRNLIYKLNVSLNDKLKSSVGFGLNYSFGDIYDEKQSLHLNNIDNKLINSFEENNKAISKLQKENEKLKDMINTLTNDIQEIKNKNIKVNKDNYIVDNFEFNKYKLSSKQKENISAFVKNKDLNSKIVVIGYTDLIGNEKYNLKLGLKRASSVKEYLISLGFDKNNIEELSFGYNKISNKEDNKLRKVEIIFK